MDSNGITYLPTSRQCFVCGEDNPASLQTRFYLDGDLVKARWRVREHHCGYRKIAHGGVTAAILDECMGWAAAKGIGRMCVTGELTVRYVLRVPADRELIVTAGVQKASRLLARVSATLCDDEGTIYAKAEGRFVPLSAEETLTVDDNMVYREGDAHLFDGLRSAGQ